jgi:DNA-binding transcriptional LysR family regulator
MDCSRADRKHSSPDDHPATVDNLGIVTADLRQLRYFVAVAEELNYTRAAERLHLAPQALSATVQQLEAALGVKLLDRTTRKVELTDAGTVLLREARRTLRQADHAVHAARRAAAGETGRLTIGFLSSTTHYVMPPVLRAFRERYPDVDLHTEDLPVADLVTGVRHGRLDGGITRPPLLDDPELTTETILTEPVAAVLPSDHPLATRRSLQLSELAHERWVLTERSTWPPWHEKYDADFRRAGFEPHVVQRGTNIQNLLALVAANVGVTRLPVSARTLRHSGVAFVPLDGDTADVVLLTRRARRPALDRFAEVLHDLAATTDLTTTG